MSTETVCVDVAETLHSIEEHLADPGRTADPTRRELKMLLRDHIQRLWPIVAADAEAMQGDDSFGCAKRKLAVAYACRTLVNPGGADAHSDVLALAHACETLLAYCPSYRWGSRLPVPHSTRPH
ncbi:hypothetical protein [Streptomyces sp. ISL-11]|uniref:hypothetical protein n=1 Tax=Streptomyces sp. ISL-11 TaxID=2819174 RepID=UPI001BE8E110|nr:hypothetical protein [Streptomyces sp. ISL-11]MBT2384570.1 hypothetical protein [Streptomyces sp. ISL-11]